MFGFVKMSLLSLPKPAKDKVLMTNEMHNSYNKFSFHSFMSAAHVSNKSSRSSSGARYNILYYTVQSVQSCCNTARLYKSQYHSTIVTIVL